MINLTAPHNDKDVTVTSILCCPLPLPLRFKGSFGSGYQMDTYYQTYTMPCSAGPVCSLIALISGQKLQEAGTVMAKVDGQTIVFKDVLQNFLKNVAYVMHNCGTNVSPCDPSYYNV